MKTDPSISVFIELGINVKKSTIEQAQFCYQQSCIVMRAFCVHTYPFDFFKPFQSNFWFMLLFYLSDYFSSAIVSYGTQTCITMNWITKCSKYMSFFGAKYPIGYFSIIPDIRLLLTVHDANLHKIRMNHVCLVQMCRYF